MCLSETDQATETERLGEQGVAFLLSLVALTILALVVTGGFYTVRQEVRAARAGEQAAATLAVSETGVADVLSNWEGERFSLLPLGGSEQVTSLSQDGSSTVHVRRLSERLYLLDSRASLYATPTHQRRVALLTRLVSPTFQTGAAALVLETATLEGDVVVTGNDFTPISWSGLCTAGTTTPGLWMRDDSLVALTPPAGLAGAPPVLESPTLNTSALHNFGGLTRSALIGIADVRLLGGTIGPAGPQVDANGNCQVSNPLNWGDPNQPTGPCGRHFPIVHITGNAQLATGTVGQGILLVDGDLQVPSGVRFYGVVAVTGRLEIDGGGTLWPGM